MVARFPKESRPKPERGSMSTEGLSTPPGQSAAAWRNRQGNQSPRPAMERGDDVPTKHMATGQILFKLVVHLGKLVGSHQGMGVGSYKGSFCGTGLLGVGELLHFIQFTSGVKVRGCPVTLLRPIKMERGYCMNPLPTS